MMIVDSLADKVTGEKERCTIAGARPLDMIWAVGEERSEGQAPFTWRT
jgi:hypothetical protein